jgi:ABC-type amino acid transport substrate-binding protein
MANKFKIDIDTEVKTPMYIVFSPSLPISKKLAGEFDIGFKKLKESREFKKILEEYGLN